MTEIAKVRRAPPARVPASKQYELFAEFFGNEADLSNTIELWDAIPKFAVTARRQVSLRDGKQRLPVHEHAFNYKKKPCRLEIQPASLKVKGRFRDFYPSADEELVEEVLRKVFADQQYGLHNAPAVESWVKFSLSMIRKELKHRGKTRSIDEIKHSIEVLAGTTIRLYIDDDDTPVYTAPILSDLTRVKRDAYLEDPSTLWVARLPALVSKSVNELSYRQFHYGTYMGLASQLARWLHKRLSHTFTNAAFNTTYDVLLSTLKRDSGMLEAARIHDNVRAVERALDELKAAAVLMDWTKEERRGGRNRIDDVKYRLVPDMEFIKQVKAANKRSSTAGAIVAGRPPLPSNRR
jgi:hypothetical protein